MAGRDVAVAFSPERIDPGNDRHSHEAVPRVVGGCHPELRATRPPPCSPGTRRRCTSVVVAGAAEMTKLYENTFRAVNIALANELADDQPGRSTLDVMEVIDAAPTKPYGFMPFYPGPGVGGHCIPCDPHYLLWQLRAKHADPRTGDRAGDERHRRPAASGRRALRGGARGVRAGPCRAPGSWWSGSPTSPTSTTYGSHRRSRSSKSCWSWARTWATTTRWSRSWSCRASAGSSSRPDPAAFGADLVVLHTAHAGLELDWVDGAAAVLDTTYRMTDLPRRAVV